MLRLKTNIILPDRKKIINFRFVKKISYCKYMYEEIGSFDFLFILSRVNEKKISRSLVRLSLIRILCNEAVLNLHSTKRYLNTLQTRIQTD